VKQVSPKGAKTDFEQEVTEDTKKRGVVAAERYAELKWREPHVGETSSTKGAKADFEQEVTEDTKKRGVVAAERYAELK
jgi:hypothetical protein